jgi:hypothetical protein
MFSVITDIYNEKTNGPTLMKLFTATGKLKQFLWQLEMFDVCTTGDTTHIDTIFKFLPHTRQHGCIDIFHCCNDSCLRCARSLANCGMYCVRVPSEGRMSSPRKTFFITSQRVTKPTTYYCIGKIFAICSEINKYHLITLCGGKKLTCRIFDC